jgi:hypothetical protein
LRLDRLDLRVGRERNMLQRTTCSHALSCPFSAGPRARRTGLFGMLPQSFRRS